MCSHWLQAHIAALTTHPPVIPSLKPPPYMYPQLQLSPPGVQHKSTGQHACNATTGVIVQRAFEV